MNLDHKPRLEPVIKDAQNKPAFEFDCLTKIKGVDPLAITFADFDWDLLRRRLNEPVEDHSEDAYHKMADALHVLLKWVTRGNNLETIGRRSVKLALLFGPELLDGTRKLREFAQLVIEGRTKPKPRRKR